VNLSRVFLFCAAVAIAAACSSGATNVTPRSAPSSTAGQGVTPSLDQTISFTVDIPAAAPPSPAAAIHKRAAATTVYLSPNTGSLSISLVAVDGVSLANPPPAKPPTNVPASCRGSSTGCQVSVPNVVAAIGVNTYTVTTFAGSNGEGAVVSSGVVSVTVSKSGTVSTIGGDPTQLALGGYVASLSVTLARTNFTFGVPMTASLVVSPKDGAGAKIVGNAQFAFPIVLSVTGAGFSLGGPGLQPDGTIQLIQPQAASPPIVLSYDGTGSGAVIHATSENGAGAPVAAPPVTISVPTPQPSPTSTSVTTLPPYSPSPIASGPTPVPTAAPSSVYVLNAYDNSIFEFNEPVKGNYSEYPRRGFGGSSLDCNEGYALLGIASDPSANVYVGAPEGLFGSCALHFFNVPPAFSGPGAPGPSTIDVPGSNSEQDLIFEFAFDAPNGSRLDFADDSFSPNQTSAYFVARVAPAGGNANPTLGYPVKRSAAEACFISAGLPNPDSTCGNAPLGAMSYFDEYNNYERNAPFAVGPDGSLYIAVFDEYLGTNPGLGGGRPAIIKVTPPNQISTGTITAEAAWIEGPNTLMSFPVALAFDAAKNSLWVYDGGLTSTSATPSTPPPIAGPGSYLLEFPLSAFNGPPGEQNIAPAAFLGGQSVSRFATSNANVSFLIQPNAVTVGDGNVFVANQLGPYDGVVSTPPPAPYDGEVDVYSDAVSGIDPNTVAPIAIYYGTTLRGPVAVTFGPHGTALGSGNLLQMPRNLPTLRKQFIAAQSRAMLLQRRRAEALHARSPRR
jgi:hypothetical protein